MHVILILCFMCMFVPTHKNLIVNRMQPVCLFVCSLGVSPVQSFLLSVEAMTLSAPGNQIRPPPATTQLCPGLLSMTKPVWPPHQPNSRSLLNMTPLSFLICIPVSLKPPLCFFSAARSFCAYLISHAAACGLWLDCDAFVLVFKTSVAIHSEGCDLCMCVTDRKERSLFRGFTVN